MRAVESCVEDIMSMLACIGPINFSLELTQLLISLAGIFSEIKKCRLSNDMKGIAFHDQPSDFGQYAGGMLVKPYKEELLNFTQLYSRMKVPECISTSNKALLLLRKATYFLQRRDDASQGLAAFEVRAGKIRPGELVRVWAAKHHVLNAHPEHGLTDMPLHCSLPASAKTYPGWLDQEILSIKHESVIVDSQ